ncbi:MAG TPA: hypothetical protein VL264_03390 [Gaiella sp.]|nr:hypothetical protein [Gaiella sp.]
MDDAVDIGFTLGLGLAAGLLLAGIFAAWRFGLVASLLGALLVGLAAGLLVRGSIGLPGAFAGALIGALSASIIARGTLRRGGTPGGTAFLFVLAAILVGMVALIPFVGYVLAVLVPVAAVRRVRQEPARHAGLRSLAK